MKVFVTPTCSHEDGWIGTGQPYAGQHVVISPNGVWIDGEPVIVRDRRAIRNRTPNHRWIADGAPYTDFIVDVRPND